MSYSAGGTPSIVVQSWHDTPWLIQEINTKKNSHHWVGLEAVRALQKISACCFLSAGTMQKYERIAGIPRVHALHLGNISPVFHPHGMKVSLIFLYNAKPKNFPPISKTLDLNCRLWVNTQFNSWSTLFLRTFWLVKSFWLPNTWGNFRKPSLHTGRWESPH